MSAAFWASRRPSSRLIWRPLPRHTVALTGLNWVLTLPRAREGRIRSARSRCDRNLCLAGRRPLGKSRRQTDLDGVACSPPTAAAVIAGFVAEASLSPAAAVSIVRDAETEALIKSYLAPLFKAAGVRSQRRGVFLVPNQSFNAFVADGSKIFVNVGAIITSQTPSELIGVLAHETAHVANGDLARFKQQLQSTKNAALLASLIGIGAAAAGAAAGVGGLSEAGAGIVAGTRPRRRAESARLSPLSRGGGRSGCRSLP